MSDYYLDTIRRVADLPLFAAAKPPAQAHSATSKAAAADIAPSAGTLRARVLAFIQARGAEGATDEEIATGLGMAGNTARPRRVELVRGGFIEARGRRKTASGKSADVWVARGGVSRADIQKGERQ